ncbi:MAG: SCO family protein, partial [Rhodospirillales bacterium]|nr:SCO family protein [Rhodospirillales bacterium]
MPIRKVYFYFGLAILVVAIGLGMRTLTAVKVSGPEIAVVTKKAAKQTGTPQIGGPFNLIDHTGRKVTEQTYRGRHMLVFFGYTHCPDVCPATLSTLSNALDLLASDADKIYPLFITVDPARDTPAALKSYLINFRPGFIGLTGKEAALKKAEHAYRVYSSKRAGTSEIKTGAHKDTHKGDDDGHDQAPDYDVDHTAITYLMGPDGAFKAFFT